MTSPSEQTLTLVADPMGEPASSEGSNLLVRALHAFRRRWVPATFLGLLCAAGAAYGVWKYLPETYTATAVLNVYASETMLPGANGNASATDFESFRLTQKALLVERSVLTAALEDSKVGQLEVVRSQPDPARWLAGQIRVSFPGNAQIMHVSLSLGDRNAAAQLVNAVVKSYLVNVVADERARQGRYYVFLEDAYGKLGANAIKKSWEEVEVDDGLPATEEARQAAFRQRVLAISIQREELSSELEALGSAGDAVIDPSPDEIAALAATDPAFGSDQVLTDLQAERLRKENLAENYRTRLRDGFAEGRVRALEAEIAELDEAIEARTREVAREVLENRHNAAIAKRTELKARIELLAKQEERFSGRISGPSEEDDDRESSNQRAESELNRMKAAASEAFLRDMAADLERRRFTRDLDVNQEFERIHLRDEAEIPRAPDEGMRLQASVAAGFFAFLLPFAGLILDDLRRYRIGATSELDQVDGLELMGTLPYAPNRGRGVESGSASWQRQFREAIDRVAAVLIRRQLEEEIRVVLVTSAVQGEGKSTLSAQLAVALAASGRRTLLVDADLRRPRLHDTFSVDQSPGLSDVLSGIAGVESTVVETHIPNLSLLTAGDWGGESLGYLTSEVSREVFDELRVDYDFVIVDGSPVLQTVDPRLLGRFVDGVVVSLLRDVSTMPRLREACRVLKAFGIPLLGTVMTGESEQLYYYESPMKSLVGS